MTFLLLYNQRVVVPVYLDGLFFFDPTNGLSSIVLQGDPLPGDNLVFGTVFNSDLLINDMGQVAFLNINVNSVAGDGGIFFYDSATGEITTVALESGTIDGVDGVVTFVSISSDSLNNNGQLVFNFVTTTTAGIGVFDISGVCLLGDVNRDGEVSFLDIAPFINLLSTGQFACEADIDQNGLVTFLDIAPFIDILSGG